MRDKYTFQPQGSLRPVLLSSLALSLGLLQNPAFAQSLHSVYQAASVADSQVRAARKGFEATLEKLPQARAGLLPTVNVTSNKNHQVGEASFSNAPYLQRGVNSWAWTAQVTQPLLRWASWVTLSQSHQHITQARAQLALAEQDLMLRTAQIYFDIVLAQENARVSDTQLAAIGEQLTLAERNFAVGTGTMTDVHEAKAKKSTALAQKIAAHNEISSKTAEIEKILGTPFTITPLRIGKSLPLHTVPLMEWIDLSREENIPTKIQKAVYDISVSETAKSKTGHAPTLDFNYSRTGNFNSGSLSSPADISTRTQSYQVGLQLTIPIFAGWATQSKIRESLLLEEKAHEEWVYAKRNAKLQVRQAFMSVQNGQAQIQALEVGVQAAQAAVEANRIGFRIGTRINPDVLNAEQQLYTTQRDLSKARVEVLIQGLKLKAAAGTLREEDLSALDAVVSPYLPAPALSPAPALLPVPTSITSRTLPPPPASQMIASKDADLASVMAEKPTVTMPSPKTEVLKPVQHWLVKSHGALMRAKPDTSSEILFKLGTGSVVAASAAPAYPPKFAYWRQVVVDGLTGWMAAETLIHTELAPTTLPYNATLSPSKAK